MKTKPVFKIFDWAGNDMTYYYGTFESFEDGWGAIYENFNHLNEDDFNEQMSEFYVEEVSDGQD